MANMSYCRFENTLNDLRDCHASMLEPTAKMSEHEQRARINMFALVLKMAEEINEMDEETQLNGDPDFDEDGPYEIG